MIRPGEPIGPSTYHRPYLALIFDLDGTIIQSALDFHAMRKAVIEIAQHNGVPPGELHTTHSVPELIDHAKTRLHQMTGNDSLSLRFEGEVNRKLDEIEMAALPTARPIAGAKEALGTLHQSGYRLGLLTRSCEGFAKSSLHSAGMLPVFEKLRTRNDSGPVKPHPESLLLLLKDLGVGKERALFVGDGTQDLECAKAAGVDFIAIVHPGEKAQEKEAALQRLGPFHLVHSFQELSRQVTGGN